MDGWVRLRGAIVFVGLFCKQPAVDWGRFNGPSGPPSCRHRSGDVGGGGNQVIILRPTIIRGTETKSVRSGSILIVDDRRRHKTVNRRIPFVFDQKPIIVI